jgi:hypothetical protein
MCNGCSCELTRAVPLWSSLTCFPKFGSAVEDLGEGVAEYGWLATWRVAAWWLVPSGLRCRLDAEQPVKLRVDIHDWVLVAMRADQ